jgi:hypothetical protein
MVERSTLLRDDGLLFGYFETPDSLLGRLVDAFRRFGGWDSPFASW